jgi:Bacterial Ig domain
VNVATFEYAYRLPQGTMSARKLEKIQSSRHSFDGAPAAYFLELADANGVVLFSQPFDTTGSFDTGPFESHPSEAFFLTVPFNPDTARIRITEHGREIGALAVSAHAPQVRLLQPIGGETITAQLIVRWEASDQDNDNLFYTVQYSPDLGASWQSVVTHTPDTTLSLSDTGNLPGSDQALIRVIATDGVNTGSAVSGPFTVQSHAPVVHIDTPSDQAIFPQNSQITLMGGARDAEDGPIGNEALIWIVNGEVVGSGKEVALGGLELGTHTVRLNAVDTDNNTAAASVKINVVNTLVAIADIYSMTENSQLTVNAPGVLGNDISTEGNPLTAVLVGNVSNGALTLNADGSFTYTPNANFGGVDSFTYKANDGTADSNIVTVTLTTKSVQPPLSDVTADLNITRSGFVRIDPRPNKDVGQFAQQVSVQNTSDSNIQGPLYLVLTGLAPETQTLVNRAGLTANVPPPGRPFIVLDIGEDDVLIAGESAEPVNLKFTTPLESGITYTIQAMAGNGLPP